MKCVIQRVTSAQLIIDKNAISSISKGLVVFVAYNNDDETKVIDFVLDKIINLRIFQDNNDKMNLSVKDINGEILLIPNFTLYADARKGRRPDFISSAPPSISEPLYQYTKEKLAKLYTKSAYGVFGANMQINLINDGPVTIIYEK